MYNAAVRSKVAYSLEIAPLNTAHNKGLDAFQQKGLKQTMGIQPTFIDRSMTNQKVLDMVNTLMFGLEKIQDYEILKEAEGSAHKPKVVKLSDYIKERAIAHAGHIFRTDTEDLVRKFIRTHMSPKDNPAGEKQNAELNIPAKIQGGQAHGVLDKNTPGNHMGEI